MTQWEYLKVDGNISNHTFNQYGRNGWELVGIRDGQRLIFKKPKKEYTKEYARVKMDIELIREMAEQGWEVVGIFQEDYEEGPLFREHNGGVLYETTKGVSGIIKNYVLLERQQQNNQ